MYSSSRACSQEEVTPQRSRNGNMTNTQGKEKKHSSDKKREKNTDKMGIDIDRDIDFFIEE